MNSGGYVQSPAPATRVERSGARRALQVAAVIVLLTLSMADPTALSARTRPHQDKPFVVVLDPGHGGSDTGAGDAYGPAVEKVLTLRVAQRARVFLRSMGFRVYLTRTRDQDVNTPARDLNHDGHITHVDEFDARNIIANRHHADLFVSIHFDASTDPSTHGPHGYYCPARPFWRKSKHLADLLTASVVSSLNKARYKVPNNGVQTDVADVVPQTRADYPWFLVLGPSVKHYVISTKMPGALIETLYLTSPHDAAALHSSKIIDAIAHGYANGIRAYFNGNPHH